MKCRCWGISTRALQQTYHICMMYVGPWIRMCGAGERALHVNQGAGSRVGLRSLLLSDGNPRFGVILPVRLRFAEETIEKRAVKRAIYESDKQTSHWTLPKCLEIFAEDRLTINCLQRLSLSLCIAKCWALWCIWCARQDASRYAQRRGIDRGA